MSEFDGYRRTRIPPAKIARDVENRTHPADNTFDRAYVKGVLPMWIRRKGHDADVEGTGGEGNSRRTRGQSDLYWDDDGSPQRRGYNRPMAEEPYTVSLAAFFEDRLARWPGTISQKDYVNKVMTDLRSTRDIGEEDGVSHAAIVQGRKRAVESFVKWAGGKEALAEALRQYLVDRESHDGKDRIKYLPRWVHG